MSPETRQELTRRPVNDGAEKWIGKEIHLLDHGFIYLVDYMGGDSENARAARNSYGPGTRSVSEDGQLIRHLLSHDHTSPFEMSEFKFHAKMPIFVARQWVRHRTASLNEMSGRYSILDKEFYIPSVDVMGKQSQINKQGRNNGFDRVQAEYIRKLLLEDGERAYEHYEYMLNDKGNGEPADPNRDMLARELSRMDLSLNYYTQWYWKIDLHNLLRFLNLRMDPHAQYEIREYANAMSKIVKDSVPDTWKAFEDFQLNAKKLSAPEIEIVSSILKERKIEISSHELKNLMIHYGMQTKWERVEFEEKIKALGITING
jgi:thymidylate synthase (FAD)